ncbi:hypothetical protein ACHAQJ_004213 [Trichoderma viride]
MSTVSPFSSKEAFGAAIEKAFNSPDSELESRILDLYTKDSIITVNRNRMTWDEFLPYIKAIRNRTMSVDIKPHHFVRDGNMFAERHSAYGHGKDGKETQAEAMLMGELNEEGKVIWLEEIAILSSSADGTNATTAT